MLLIEVNSCIYMATLENLLSGLRDLVGFGARLFRRQGIQSSLNYPGEIFWAFLRHVALHWAVGKQVLSGAEVHKGSEKPLLKLQDLDSAAMEDLLKCLYSPGA